jgi:hypothetical protein
MVGYVLYHFPQKEKRKKRKENAKDADCKCLNYLRQCLRIIKMISAYILKITFTGF